MKGMYMYVPSTLISLGNEGLNVLGDATRTETRLGLTTAQWIPQSIDQGGFSIATFAHHEEDLWDLGLQL